MFEGVRVWIKLISLQLVMFRLWLKSPVQVFISLQSLSYTCNKLLNCFDTKPWWFLRSYMHLMRNLIRVFSKATFSMQVLYACSYVSALGLFCHYVAKFAWCCTHVLFFQNYMPMVICLNFVYKRRVFVQGKSVQDTLPGIFGMLSITFSNDYRFKNLFQELTAHIFLL